MFKLHVQNNPAFQDFRETITAINGTYIIDEAIYIVKALRGPTEKGPWWWRAFWST